jgi:3-deoxy-D-manno-octulosonate 8-phosphate phosphatase (KDO 8-P phosphatase)
MKAIHDAPSAPRDDRGASWPALERLHTVIFDFDGVFTDNNVYVSDEGRELVRCSRGDGLGVAMLRRYAERHGGSPHVFVLSTELNTVVTSRARKLKLECRQGVADKVAAVEGYFAERRPTDAAPYAGMLFAANDLNDLALIQRAAYSVVPADAHPLVKRAATFTMPQRGGEGFVRAVIERLLQLDTLSMEEICGLVSDR